MQAKSIGVFFSGFAAGALAVTLLVSRGGPLPPVSAAAKSAAPAPVVESGPRIGLPIAGLRAKDIQDTFSQLRSGTRPHEATDILAPRGTPVLAVDAGTIKKLFTSKPGGLTVYQFDSLGVYCYYYAHLDRYAADLKEGMTVSRGDVIGYVGTTGNAPVNTPHLHFAIFKLGVLKRWWEGTPINPYPSLMEALRDADGAAACEVAPHKAPAMAVGDRRNRLSYQNRRGVQRSVVVQVSRI
jgi:peptidoglycan LD-endopeptidase LytH